MPSSEPSRVGEWRIAFGGATVRQIGDTGRLTLFALRFDIHDPGGRQSRAPFNVEELTFGSYSFWEQLQPHQQARLGGALERLVLQRVSAAVEAGGVEPGRDLAAASIGTDDIEELMVFVADKLCRYRTEDSFGQLECNVWTPSDGSPEPVTSALCHSCALPDSAQICSHLRHPRVTTYQSPGQPRLTGAACDIGRAEVRSPSRCHVGQDGHSCASRLVRVHIKRRQGPPVSGRQVVDALDHLALAWREATGERLLDSKVLGPAAALTEDVATSDDLAGRMTALASLLKQIRVTDGQLADSDIDRFSRDASANAPLNRMAAALAAHIRDEADRGRAVGAVKTLQRLNAVRNAMQHPESRHMYRRELRHFGLDGFVADWSASWAEILGFVHAALGDIRTGIQSGWN